MLTLVTILFLQASEFRGMSREDMLDEISKCKNALFDLRMKQSTRQEVKTDQFRKLKKKVGLPYWGTKGFVLFGRAVYSVFLSCFYFQVAVIRTVMREQEVAQGVSKRDSRKIKYWERKNNMYV